VRDSLEFVFERWDGRGFPAGAKSEAIPLVARVLHVARDLDVFASIGDARTAADVVRKRPGRAYEPDLATVATDNAPALLEGLDDPWAAAVEHPAAADAPLGDEEVDAALTAVADFADLKTGDRPPVS
jgi:HD domain